MIDPNDDHARTYTAAEIREFNKAAKILKRLCDDGAIIYLEENHLHLMSGTSHDGRDRPCQHRIVASETLRGAGGGGW